MPTFQLNVPYHDRDKAKADAKNAGGRLRWDPAQKTWFFEGAAVPATLKLYLPKGESAMATASPTKPTRSSATPGRTSTAKTSKPQVHVLDVPYNSRGYAQEFGARWSGKYRVMVYEGGDLPPQLRHYKSPPHSWERWQEDEINGVISLGEPGTNPRAKPREWQPEAINLIVKVAKAGRQNFLLADEVGLGKTWQTVFALQQLPEFKTVLIVATLDGIATWRDVITQVGSVGKRYIVLSWGSLHKLFEADAKTKKKIKSKKGVAKMARAMGFDVVVFDESHRQRHSDTARAKLGAKLRAASRFSMDLSATAGQTPLELAYLAPLLAETTGARVSELKDWEQWCQSQGIQLSRGKFGKWIWESNEADLETIRQMLYGGKLPAGIRRTPKSIKGWPDLQRILHPVELSPAEWNLYEAAWSEFVYDMGLDGNASDSSNPLVRQLRFRQKASLLRTRPTVDLALNLLENGRQVAISVAFHDTMHVIQEAIEKEGHRCVLIHGQMSRPEKERQRHVYQRGERRVCLFTVTESISLHQENADSALRAQIDHDLRWSGIDAHQVDGRSHRDGKQAIVYWPYGVETIEERIAKTMAERLEAIGAMQGDNTHALQALTREIDQMIRAESRKRAA